ncbi:MAG TPA: imidazole glycerol phosphate synthase subunit HisH [Methylotenera sp.]|nr:imidazole glycerol phosphate synthase subunit HisH [Methylotenera sp.]HPH04752.1 imidazole glycerol phosphate synthase subunit HisH [Methylotenera sp.]HPN01195.1 imidazole glycerol phosphate synthase subunit HisH [Methylotenera sp.]
MSKKITLLDYGMGNLLNVARAFEHVGAEVKIAETPQDAVNADRLVVPGVGAFKDSIAEVRRRGFDDVIRQFISTERPFFGICVGMQMLFDVSEEFGTHKGLGILPGKVEKIPEKTTDGYSQKIPHIGWNSLIKPDLIPSWRGTLLDRYEVEHPSVYFVHSFSAVPTIPSDRLADCVYGGHRICAAVQRNNIVAVQFHPERSGNLGLELIDSFARSF